jgi:hypothetical protein
MALLYQSCLSPDIEGQLHAMCPLLVNCPNMGQRNGGLCKRRRALFIPHELLLVCALDIGEGGVTFVEREIRPV